MFRAEMFGRVSGSSFSGRCIGFGILVGGRIGI